MKVSCALETTVYFGLWNNTRTKGEEEERRQIHGNRGFEYKCPLSENNEWETEDDAMTPLDSACWTSAVGHSGKIVQC